MANYRQALRLLTEAGELKRCYYIYGPDRTLVEHLADTVRQLTNAAELDRASLSGSEHKTNEILASLNQYPSEPKLPRLTVVRDAERIKAWDGITDWLTSRHIPQSHAIFIDGRHSLDTTLSHLERITKSGRLVRCGPTNEDDGLAFLDRILPGCDRTAAKHLLRRAGSIDKAANAARKCRALNVPLDERLADRLCEAAPADDLVEALSRMRKRDALEAAAITPEEDYGRTLGALDHRLDVLHRLHRARQRQDSIRDLITKTKLPAFLVLDLQDAARHYDRNRVRQCAQALALADSAYQAGHRTGVLELLVSLW